MSRPSVSSLTDEWVSGWLKTAPITLTIWDIFHVQRKLRIFLIGRDAKHKQSSELHSKFFGRSSQDGKPGSQMAKVKGLPSRGGMCVGLSERGPALPLLCFSFAPAAGYLGIQSVTTCTNSSLLNVALTQVFFIPWKKDSILKGSVKKNAIFEVSLVKGRKASWLARDPERDPLCSSTAPPCLHASPILLSHKLVYISEKAATTTLSLKSHLVLLSGQW